MDKQKVLFWIRGGYGMRFSPVLGVLMMGNVEGYQHAKVAEGLVDAWMYEK